MSKSKIEWTEETWNPIVGCTIVSPGCTNCYAMRMAARIERMGNRPHYDGLIRSVKGNAIWTGKLALAPESTLLAPLRRKKPTTYFVNSMGDLFHEDAPNEWIDKVFAVMALCPQHTFQVLTKRAERMRDYFHNLDAVEDRTEGYISEIVGKQNGPISVRPPLPNVWLGVSCERQQEANERIPHLLATPAAIRFISAEPLLGPIDFRMLSYESGNLLPEAMRVNDERCSINALTGVSTWPGCHYQSPVIKREARIENGTLFESGGEYRGIDWVIVGGESGPKARPMKGEWAVSLRDQCVAAGIAFFFKQWGTWSANGDRAATKIRNLMGREWNEVPL
jgi:protein gp37